MTGYNDKNFAPIPCWMLENETCIKGIQGRFLQKATQCMHCEVFNQAAQTEGLSGQEFIVKQLQRYDDYIVSKLQNTNTLLKKKVDELSVLLDISTLMQGTTDLDEILYIILSGLTAGFALGFNRALVFLVDDSRKELIGKLGVGPATGEEANQIWTAMDQTEEQTLARMVNLESIQAMKNSYMTRLAAKIRKPLDPEKGILARTIVEKKTFLITDAYHDSRVNRDLLDILKSPTFVTVPLLAKDKAIGALYVDNFFTQEPLTDEDLNSLTRFSALAGLAIAETMAYERIEHFNEQLEIEIARAKEELQVKERELAHKEKLAALGQMAAGVAHELRNPMTAVRGFAQRIYRRVPPEDANKRYAAIIIEEMDRINHLIKDILDFGRKDDPVFELLNIQESLEEVLFLFKESFHNHPITVKRDYAPVGPFYFDEGQMKQVFTNIIFNAIDVLKDGGILTLRTRLDDHGVCIDIQDTGPGIWPEIVKDIFNPFFTTKPSGTGLGLSIAHRLVEMHSGDIKVTSHVGKGTIFTIKLPYRLNNPNIESET